MLCKSFTKKITLHETLQRSTQTSCIVYNILLYSIPTLHDVSTCQTIAISFFSVVEIYIFLKIACVDITGFALNSYDLIFSGITITLIILNK